MENQKNDNTNEDLNTEENQSKIKNSHLERFIIEDLLGLLYNKNKLSEKEINQIEYKIENNSIVKNYWRGINLDKESNYFISKKSHLEYLENECKIIRKMVEKKMKK